MTRSIKNVVLALTLIVLTGCTANTARVAPVSDSAIIKGGSIATGDMSKGSATGTQEETRSVVNVTGKDNTANLKSTALGAQTESVVGVSGTSNTATVDSIGMTDKTARVRQDEILDANSPKSLAGGLISNGAEENAVAEVITGPDGTSVRATAKHGVASVAIGEKIVSSFKIYDLSKSAGTRYRVVGANKPAHFHLLPYRSTKEGGKKWSFDEVEMTVPLPNGAVVFSCEQTRENLEFVYGYIAVDDITIFARNPKDVAALKSMVVGKTTEGFWILGGYFLTTTKLYVETTLNVQPVLAEYYGGHIDPALHKRSNPEDTYRPNGNKPLTGSGSPGWVEVKNQ